MELQYFGANSVKITTKKSVISIDPSSDIADIKHDLKKTTAVLATQEKFVPKQVGESFLVDGPGEYEFADYSVKGVATRVHTEASGDMSATMYRIITHDTTILITGHVYEKLSEEQLESIGTVDVVIVPVGGNGYTLDALGAANIVRELEPKLIIPVHAKDDGLAYSVPQNEIDLFVKELGAPVAEEEVDKLKLKSLPEQMTIQILKRS